MTFNVLLRESNSRKKNISIVSQNLCKIDNFFDSLVQSGINNILLYKELNTPSGNKGLIIWKRKNCVYGVKFTEDFLDGCKKEEIKPDNPKLGLIALKFFYDQKKDYSVTQSKVEVMHDFKVEIRALVNEEEMRKEFFNSSTRNKSEFLPEISMLCKDIIYNW